MLLGDGPSRAAFLLCVFRPVFMVKIVVTVSICTTILVVMFVVIGVAVVLGRFHGSCSPSLTLTLLA